MSATETINRLFAAEDEVRTLRFAAGDTAGQIDALTAQYNALAAEIDRLKHVSQEQTREMAKAEIRVQALRAALLS